MYTDITKTETKNAQGMTKVSHLEDVARTIRDDAFATARAQMPASQKSLDTLPLLHIPAFFNAFKFRVAKSAARVIAANDERVSALYLFEESANPDAGTEEYLPLDATIHLLVRVQSNSAALEAFVASLDRALAFQMSELPTRLLSERKSILDVICVTERDIENGTGFASLLSSLFAPPVRIWSSEA